MECRPVIRRAALADEGEQKKEEIKSKTRNQIVRDLHPPPVSLFGSGLPARKCKKNKHRVQHLLVYQRRRDPPASTVNVERADDFPVSRRFSMLISGCSLSLSLYSFSFLLRQTSRDRRLFLTAGRTAFACKSRRRLAGNLPPERPPPAYANRRPHATAGRAPSPGFPL